jgi:mono/diheme cytochrome c family protein
VHEVVAGHSAGDILEAVREGEDGMPRFTGLTLDDARNIAAYLRDPSAVTTPTTPPDTGTGGTGGTTPPGPAPTYTTRIAALLSANCVACHSGTGAMAGIRLDNYTGASRNAARALTAIEAGRMPPSGPLSAADVQAFRDWVAAGTPK